MRILELQGHLGNSFGYRQSDPDVCYVHIFMCFTYIFIWSFFCCFPYLECMQDFHGNVCQTETNNVLNLLYDSDNSDNYIQSSNLRIKSSVSDFSIKIGYSSSR